MKKAIIAILLSCIMGIAFAQVNQPLDGFWGLKWNSDTATVKEAIKNKGSYKLLMEETGVLAYSGTFGGDDATIILTFYEEKLYAAAVVYPYKKNMAIQKYREVKSQLSKKYGKPDADIENFKSPYSSGDGYEETAIKINKAFFWTEWVFSDKNTISITITSDLEVFLRYANVEVQEKINKEKQKKNLSDF